MSYRTPISPFNHLGNFMMSLGLIPIFKFAGTYACTHFGLPGFLSDLFFDVSFIVFMMQERDNRWFR